MLLGVHEAETQVYCRCLSHHGLHGSRDWDEVDWSALACKGGVGSICTMGNGQQANLHADLRTRR